MVFSPISMYMDTCIEERELEVVSGTWRLVGQAGSSTGPQAGKA